MLEIMERSLSNSNTNGKREDGVREQQLNSNGKGESYAVITMECCPNQGKIRSLQLPLGTLCRLVVPNVQSEKATIPKTMCHMSNSKKQDESRVDRNNPKNPLLIVEMIANKKDRKRVANYFSRWRSIWNLLRGMVLAISGMLRWTPFYGRVFEWDESMCFFLWLLFE
jgi:hypothetical protein